MGTSKSYKPTSQINPALGSFSGYITKVANASKPKKYQLNQIVTRFIEHAGGRHSVIKGTSKVHGRAGLKTAKNLGSFFSSVSVEGFKKTIIKIGIERLEGKSVKEVIDYLTISFAEDSVSLDDVAARKAARQVLEELTENIDDIEELEAFFNSKDVSDINEILIKFFGIYLYESISLKFEEKIRSEKPNNYESLFYEIKQYIIERTKKYHKENDITKIKWNSIEGEEYISNLYNEILENVVK